MFSGHMLFLLPEIPSFLQAFHLPLLELYLLWFHILTIFITITFYCLLFSLDYEYLYGFVLFVFVFPILGRGLGPRQLFVK